MPFISSVRGSYGAQGRFGRSGPGPMDLAIATAFGSSTSFSTSTQGYYTEIDFRGIPASGSTYRFTLKGGNGGNTSGGNRGGYGAQLVVDIPSSALANKIIGFVCAGNGSDNNGGRATSGGGGFSGIIQMAALGTYQTTTHIASAAGGGGSSGPGDQGTGDQGIDSTSIVTSGSPSGGLDGLHKAQNGTTGRWTTFNYSARPGNAWGGGDCVAANGSGNADYFPPGGGGGFGPLAGGNPSLTTGPGVRSGIAAVADYGFGVNPGGFGGGGSGNGGGNGAVAWRVCGGGGGGGGFIGGEGGGYTSDGNAAPGQAGTSCVINGSQVSFSSANSGQPSLSFVKL